MTEPNGRRASIQVRLITAFVAVAITAVAVFASLTVWRSRHTVDRLTSDRQMATATVIADTLTLGYRQNGSWATVDSHPATMLAVQAGAALVVRDAEGKVVELRSSMPGMAVAPDGVGRGPTREVAVTVDGEIVGYADVTFVDDEPATAERHVRDALRGTVVLGALGAAAVAVAGAVFISRRIVRPVHAMTGAARAVADGDHSMRVGRHDAPGEIGELARAFDDMADRLEADEAARRHLATDLAHEVRTPLTVLLGNCEELIDGISEPTLERLVQMHDDLLRLSRLLDDLDHLADADAVWIERGLRREECDLATILQEVLVSHATATAEHELSSVLRPVFASVDPRRIRQIAGNLLMNAVKYTPPGGTISVRTGEDPLTGHALLVVSDDGPGIAPAERLKVFERFYRSPSALGVQGSGVGLAVVEQLVRAHAGEVKLIDSEVGTTIEVRLPRTGPSHRSECAK